MVSDFSRNDSDGDHAPFNMAMLFYIDLNDLWKKKDEAYISNNVLLWYKYLNRIFVKIQFKLTDDEFKNIKAELDAVKNRLLSKEKGDELYSSLMDIDYKIVQLLHKYRMIFPNIDNVKGLQKVIDRYNLNKKEE